MAETVQRDLELRERLGLLSRRGMVRGWAAAETPYSDLVRDCTSLRTDAAVLRDFTDYLQTNPIICNSIETFLAHVSVASFARCQDIPMPAQLYAWRGVWIGRWLPAFLVIDGPLGHFLRASISPLNVMLRRNHAGYPTLAQARDLFNHDLFRHVRNGVGHWSFVFEGTGVDDTRLVCFNWETGSRTAEVSVLEAEALFLASFSIVECLDRFVFRHAVRPRGTG